MSIFSGHPKGLYGAALSNMGERFGFYIMMAILSLFLMSKFGLEPTQASIIYSIFYASIYLLALVGGIIADKTKKYKTVILIGIVLMAVGYLLIAIPTPTPVPNLPLYLTMTCFGLFTIAFGNGLFKGNLQAVVGQMYDNNEYSARRDQGFQLFYMFINVGALVSPLMAVGMRNWWVESNGFAYNSALPALCHGHLNGTLTADAANRFSDLAASVSNGIMQTDLTAFANTYLDVFNTGFHYAFGIAIIALLISFTIYIANRRRFPDPAAKKVATGNAAEVEMSKDEIKQRLYALFAVYAIVIFFWFSFHQNGLTLTFFAKDYVNLEILQLNLGFTTLKGAEIFQSFNPFFVVFLTPIIIGLFGWLKARGKEPSTPKKIAIGMGIAMSAFVVMALGSYGLPDYAVISPSSGTPLSPLDPMRVTPWLLIGTYFILTVAELFISPLGISFVSKVAPPKYQGLMQGCWLGATAIGNQLLLVGAVLYENIPIWITWCVFAAVCLVSMFIMLRMLKWLESVAK